MLSKKLKPVVMGKVAGSDGNGSGVGVGIVAALQKSQGVRRKLAVCVPNLNPSSNFNPINGKDCDQTSGSLGDYDDHKIGISNINRIATFNSNNITRKNKKRVFDNYMSPPPPPSTQDVTMMRPFPTSDFLSSCDLCQKKLHGKDIYMYRGEKAFCSMECRYRQIVMDERKEQYHSSQASISSAHVSDQSPYTCNNSYTDKSNIFSTGILAI